MRWTGLLVAAFFAAPALAGADALQPGDRLETAQDVCTLGFAFDGVGDDAGRVFFATAAHCVDALGEVASSPGFPAFGAVVALDAGADVALLEVREGDRDAVLGEVLGHPGSPKGVTSDAETAAGDVLFLSGHGLVFSATKTTRERRAGALLDDDAATYGAALAAVPLDSGGPVLHQRTGKALGLVSEIHVFAADDPVPRHRGPTVERVLEVGGAAGLALAIRTAG